MYKQEILAHAKGLDACRARGEGYARARRGRSGRPTGRARASDAAPWLTSLDGLASQTCFTRKIANLLPAEIKGIRAKLGARGSRGREDLVLAPRRARDSHTRPGPHHTRARPRVERRTKQHRWLETPGLEITAPVATRAHGRTAAAAPNRQYAKANLRTDTNLKEPRPT